MIESFGILPLKRQGSSWHIFVISHLNGSHWSFPKGRKEEGEEPKESAARELKEETGLEVKAFLDLPPFVETYAFTRKREDFSKKVTYFAAEVTGEVALQKSEISDGLWLDLQTAMNTLTFSEAKNILRQLIEKLQLEETT